MLCCDICGKECKSREQYAGHRSGHVRRGEIKKGLNVRKSANGICKFCGKQFDNPFKLGGHVRKHNLHFDDLKSYTSKKFRLIDEMGHKCQICELTTWLNKPIPLEIDHIDGDSTNNHRDNLRIICPNCHAQTSTFRGRNIGKNPDLKRAHRLRKSYGLYR